MELTLPSLLPLQPAVLPPRIFVTVWCSETATQNCQSFLKKNNSYQTWDLLGNVNIKLQSRIHFPTRKCFGFLKSTKNQKIYDKPMFSLPLPLLLRDDMNYNPSRFMLVIFSDTVKLGSSVPAHPTPFHPFPTRHWALRNQIMSQKTSDRPCHLQLCCMKMCGRHVRASHCCRYRQTDHEWLMDN